MTSSAPTAQTRSRQEIHDESNLEYFFTHFVGVENFDNSQLKNDLTNQSITRFNAHLVGLSNDDIDLITSAAGPSGSQLSLPLVIRRRIKMGIAFYHQQCANYNRVVDLSSLTKAQFHHYQSSEYSPEDTIVPAC